MSSASPADSLRPPGRREAFRPDWLARAGWLLLALYTVYAIARLDFNLDRFVSGLDNGHRFLARMFPPRIAQPDSLLKGLAESLEIAVLASFAGIVLALPIAPGSWLYKERQGQASEPGEPTDAWGGVVPIVTSWGDPVAAPWTDTEVPASVRRLAGDAQA